MDASANPFAALALIAAPAILTNACSVLVLSTSTRLARAVDRARELSVLLEQGEETEQTLDTASLRELNAAEQRSVLLVRALRHFYTALGGFAGAAFVSVCGAVFATRAPDAVVLILELIALFGGLMAVSSLLAGSFLLIRETRIAVAIVHERAVDIQAKVSQRLQMSEASPAKN